MSAIDASAAEERFEQITAYVEDYVRMAAFDGIVLIAEDATVVYEHAFGFADYDANVPVTPDTVFRIASLSKQVTQAAIGRLIDRRKLAFETSLDEYLPGFPRAGDITIGQLIDHTAGVAHTNRLGWMDMETAMTLDSIVSRLASEPLLFEPGAGTEYSNGGYALLAKVIEVVSGKSFDAFIADEFGAEYPSIGHEDAFEDVPRMATRYAPGPVYGERVPAETYITANRIGGGSLHASAADVLRFFRDTYAGRVVSTDTTARLFPPPDDGDIQVTGRSPGALAQVYLDFKSGLSVVTLSSNSAWPGSFNTDIVSLYRGEVAALTTFSLATRNLTDAEADAVVGDYVAERFGWEVSISRSDDGFIFKQGEMLTAFARTTDGEYHLPVYDWLCRVSDQDISLECRQRDPDAEIRFRFRSR